MKRNSLLLLLAVFVLLVFSAADAAWFGNDAPACPEGCKSSEGVVDGASNFLQSYSHFFLLLNESELSTKSGFDFKKAETAVGLSIEKIVESKKYFSIYVECLENNTQIAAESKNEFVSFDYSSIVEKRNLNPYIMEQVSSYLSQGDIHGLFFNCTTNMEEIINLLAIVNESIKKSEIPDIEVLRTLHQKYTELMNIGYYSSLVFSAIKSK